MSEQPAETPRNADEPVEGAGGLPAQYDLSVPSWGPIEIAGAIFDAGAMIFNAAKTLAVG